MNTTPVLVAVGLIGVTASAQRSPELLAPVQIEADGAAIDTGKDIGYAGPLVRDHDGDGKPDLLVSAFRGNIRFFKNVGTATDPRFEEGPPLAAGGQPIKIHNW